MTDKVDFLILLICSKGVEINSTKSISMSNNMSNNYFDVRIVSVVAVKLT